MLNPAVIILSLLLCVEIYSQELTPSYFALAALAFLIASQVVSEPVMDCSARNGFLNLLQHRIFAEWLLVSAALLLMAFAFKVTETFSRRVILTWFAITPFVVVAAEAALRRYAAFSALRGKIQQSHVIIGANDAGYRLARRLMAHPHLGLFKGFFDNRDTARLPDIPQEQLLGGMADIVNYVRLNGVSNIYICLPMRADARVTKLLEELKDTTASVYFVPDIFMFDLMQARVCDIDGIPMLAVCETPFAGLDGVIKRASDIVFSSVLLLMLWPLLLIVAIGVRLSSPGPVLFRQRRYGMYGEAINVYKFRSMSVCEDGGNVTQAQRNDPRVTRFGSFLRRTSLDELPQLFNVFLGSMSLVGPRPHAVAHNEEYRRIIEGYMLRHKVRPGITGWAQVNGLRGETDTVDKMQRRVEYDLDYLRNWSLGLDLTILLRTASLVWRDRNAY
ncbi:undecaprenyl-phosphate glucose phosphotransferase [Steroidobacter sp.]|uniref:undecaprenyl-phosphate glucose phosphotransferase n=1 Tax=Steroidobacter sp. TaxID=1978227 RepID=UPI001A4CDABA|nr:undecaprenyl-phosphate glucose phosphotransferase [Steroidobacter sp.]MBL8272047.1 undecaprenyl-phosphate glucose phosphotransferase [Steroidobacter sp.]